MFILSKNCDSSLNAINKTNIFSTMDPYIFAILVLDGIKETIKIKIEWIYKGNIVLENIKKCIPDSSAKKNRIAFYLKTAAVEYSNFYGDWVVRININDKFFKENTFKIVKQISNYGNDANVIKKQINNIINIEK